MVELAPFYILVLRGPSLIVEAYNPRYARLIESRSVQGRPLDEVIDLFWEAGVEIVHLARDAYRLDKVHTTPRTLTILPKTQDLHGEPAESYFTYTIVPSHDSNGKVDGVLIYALDETEKRTRETEEERKKLKLIFEHFSQAALALYDAQTTELIMGSPRYLESIAQAHGLSQNDLVGHKWSELSIVGSREEAQELWNRVLESRTSHRISELSHKFAPENKETTWDYSLTPIMDPEHPQVVRYMFVSAVEITEQVQVRKQLEQLDSLKDEFLSLATHELRNPLTTIQANAQMLQRNLQRQAASPANDGSTSQQLDREITMLGTIIHQVSRMNKLIGEMSDVTRIRSNVFELYPQEHVNVVELARQVVEQYRTRNTNIDFQTSEEKIQSTVDTDRIEQVLNNLIDNAIKYSPPNTQIEVKVTRHISVNPGGVVISVHDEGPGMSQEQQEHIFERFYRANNASGKEKPEGLGLGLYIAHEIIAQQGGHIWVESQPGQGCTFYFSLPLEKPD